MKSFAAIVVLVAAVIAGTVWYRHRVSSRALESGEVYEQSLASGRATPLPSEAPQRPAGDQIATTATPQPPAAPAAPAAPPVAAVPVAPPSGDSIPRNPPNGLAFAGAGKFQLYRQGDITWRLDTQTGEACILFATDTQWRQPRVFQSGCGTRSVTSITTGY